MDINYIERIWGVVYDPISKTMDAGLCNDVDSNEFTPLFHITEIEKEDILDAVATCAVLYSSYGIIVSSYESLKEEYEKTH